MPRQKTPQRSSRTRRASTAPRRDRRRVLLLVGTRKGAFIFQSNSDREQWKLQGPHFPGWSVLHMALDRRRGSPGTLFAALDHAVYGANVHWSDDLGQSWQMSDGPAFPPEAGRTVKRIWRVEPGHALRPAEVWAGVDPAALFKSEDCGQTWQPVPDLNAHPTRERWMEGGGGLMVHGILMHPTNPDRLFVSISVGGVYRSDDGGRTWQPKNRGSQACFLPEGQQWPEAGQCCHHLVMSGSNPDLLFQQNHCGVYRTDDAGEQWTSITAGLPSRFGFPMAALPHAEQTIYVVPEVSDEFRFTPNGAFAVYRSRDGGRRWQKLSRGLPQRGAYLNVLREGLATDTARPGGVYVGTSTGQVFYSRDEGNTWARLADCLPPVHSLAAVVLD